MKNNTMYLHLDYDILEKIVSDNSGASVRISLNEHGISAKLKVEDDERVCASRTWEELGVEETPTFIPSDSEFLRQVAVKIYEDGGVCSSNEHRLKEIADKLEGK